MSLTDPDYYLVEKEKLFQLWEKLEHPEDKFPYFVSKIVTAKWDILPEAQDENDIIISRKKYLTQFRGKIEALKYHAKKFDFQKVMNIIHNLELADLDTVIMHLDQRTRKDFFCGACNKWFDTKSDLDQHDYATHER